MLCRRRTRAFGWSRRVARCTCQSVGVTPPPPAPMPAAPVLACARGCGRLRYRRRGFEGRDRHDHGATGDLQGHDDRNLLVERLEHIARVDWVDWVDWIDQFDGSCRDRHLRLGNRLGRLIGIANLPRRPLRPPTLPPGLYRWKWRRRVAQCLPVEPYIRVLPFQCPHHIVVQGLASDFDVRRRPKPVQDLLPHLATAARRLVNEGEVLVAAFVSDNSKEWHGRRQAG